MYSFKKVFVPFIITLFLVFILFAYTNFSSKLSNESYAQASITNPELSTTEAEPIVEEEGFALLELYTSEGCSSCPPADDIANEIAEKAEENQERIFVLAFHVDYWNRLGWKDRFSSPKYSQRQYWYANQLNSRSVYTPQIIVNGTDAFVGSRRAQAETAVQAAIKKTTNSKIKLELETTSEDVKTFRYAITGDKTGLRLHYALIEKHQKSKVTAGENRGRNLYHYSVVKEFHSLSSPQVLGKASIDKLPTNQEQFSIIAFLQDPNDSRIVAADKLDISLK